MRILLISTSDIGHGAGIAAYRLLEGLRRSGHQVSMLVAEKRSTDADVFAVLTPPVNLFGRGLFRFQQFLERGLNFLGVQSLYSVRGKALLQHELIQSADVIHLHNLHWHSQNLSLLALPALARVKPVVWTIHDMWPLTGHCLYALDCDRWRSGCGACPDLRSYMGTLFDLTSFMVGVKRKLVGGSKVTVLSPSRWLRDLLAASPIFEGSDIRSLPNGVDTEAFRPQLREAARRELGVGADTKVILFASSYLDDHRKGGMFFVEAVRRLALDREGTLIVSVGKGDMPEAAVGGLRVRNLGYLTDTEQMARIYAAADVYVMPTLQDNLPNVVLESLSCGTPVACFDSGGLNDMVVHRHNGWLARPRDIEDLAAGIRYLLSFSDHSPLRENARNSVLEKFSLEQAAASHLAVYRERAASWRTQP